MWCNFSNSELLPQGVGLCHGMAGNGYALLSLYRLTGDETHLRRAQHFGAFMAEHWRDLYEVPDAPAALYLVCLLPLTTLLGYPVAVPWIWLMCLTGERLRRGWREQQASGRICKTQTMPDSPATSSDCSLVACLDVGRALFSRAAGACCQQDVMSPARLGMRLPSRSASVL